MPQNGLYDIPDLRRKSTYQPQFSIDDFQRSLHTNPAYSTNKPQGTEIAAYPENVSRFNRAEDLAALSAQQEDRDIQSAKQASVGNVLTNPNRLFPSIENSSPAHLMPPGWNQSALQADFSTPDRSEQPIPASAALAPTQPNVPSVRPAQGHVGGNAGGDLNGTLSYLGNRPAYQELSRRSDSANLAAQGYRALELPGSSPDALPTGVMKQQGQGVKGSALPELQAQYAKQGIEFDPNALYEQMNYAIPGAKGSASGWRKVDPNRQQGSFSVAPALSDADQQRYNQIVENQTRQREYAQGRGHQWDAMQSAKASNTLAALKQMLEQQQHAQTQAMHQATL